MVFSTGFYDYSNMFNAKPDINNEYRNDVEYSDRCVKGIHGRIDELGFYVPFNSISVIPRRWTGEHERLCAMKHR